MALVLVTGCAPLMVGAPAGGTAGADLLGPLGAQIDAIFDTPEFAHSHWGVLIRSSEGGEVVCSRHPVQLFVPASNVKLMTAAAALETLGPDYRYRTTLAAGGPVSDGAIRGPLVVIGTGDPTFSSRFLDDPRSVFRAWADSLRAHGITRIAGSVIGVDTAFAEPTLGAGWAWDDLDSGYAAEFGALQFNESVVELDIFPSRAELEPAVTVLSPPTQHVRIVNDTRTLPSGSNTAIRIIREEGGASIVVRGEIAADDPGLSRTVAVRNPALYLASVLRETLRENGIAVEGPAIHYSAVGLIDPALRSHTPIFEHYSPPLSEILAGMMKPSQNQIAETLLRTIGREVRGDGSANGGVAVVDSLLAAWEIEPRHFNMADGSGLSRYDLLSPALVVELLEHMDRSAHRDVWLASLPVAGRDGTLEMRMRDPPLAEQVLAKTGSLSGVSSLSGYLTAASGERFVFSTMVNNNLLGSSAADAAVESALQVVAANR